jgi:two-component system chemotaxis response regulator CheY
MARVLVVDDAAFMRKVLSDALAAGGHEVVGEAGDGDAAIAAYRDLRPEKDGIATLRELVDIDPAARVVICSALGQETKVLDAIKAGAKDFVVKPFERERLLGAVEKAVA